MRIESVDAFYLSMPEVRPIGDGSQDMLLVRVRADGHEGWGECEASPLTSIAALVCPMSHSACRPVLDSVLGTEIDSPADIGRLVHRVRTRSADLLQADHALSGIEIALWDLLGRKEGVPVWRLLGHETAFPKTAYASALFGDDPDATRRKARELDTQGWRAVKFGWGPFGRTLSGDEDHVRAARAGLGDSVQLFVDAGTVWGDDVEAAALRLDVLRECNVTWLEEPFFGGALDAYHELARRAGPVALAGGEGSHDHYMARHMIDRAGLGYVQIDAGRIGGIGDSATVARYADSVGIRYVNHTFTSHLALSASLQAFAGMEGHGLSEYPVEASPLAQDLTFERIRRDDSGRIEAPSEAGLGMTPRPEVIDRYLLDVTITVGDRVLYRTPDPRD